jgi:hypothetical protein
MLLRLGGGEIFSYLRIIRGHVKESLLINLHWKIQSLARPGKNIKICTSEQIECALQIPETFQHIKHKLAPLTVERY